MSLSVYEEKGLVANGTSTEPFVKAILPFLQVYGIFDNPANFDGFKNCIYGDPNGARIEFQYSGGYIDPYVGGSSMRTLRSFQLARPETGEILDLQITIKDVAWSHTEITLLFRGETSEIGALVKAVKPVLENCMRK